MQAAVEQSPATERHYSPSEIAEMWGISTQTVIALFRDEPGVVTFSIRRIQSKRAPRTTLRVPLSVLERLHSQWSRGFDPKAKRAQRAIQKPLVSGNPRRVVALSGAN